MYGINTDTFLVTGMTDLSGVVFLESAFVFYQWFVTSLSDADLTDAGYMISVRETGLF